MKTFEGKLAVLTGGGTGMGRAMARQLAREGCHVAMCDISEEEMATTKALCEKEGAPGVRISTHKADVSSESDILAFRDAVMAEHQTDHINLLINNAGIGGMVSFVDGPRDRWEKVFNVCWYGVYYNCRAFMPLLVKASEGHIVNVSSVNGFWATLGPDSLHSAYCTAKFAVKGFSEALITDLRQTAPHVKVSVVMPGHIATKIAVNSHNMMAAGEPISERGKTFEEMALTSSEEAASIILEGVREGKWRILVGPDAERLDRVVRRKPEQAYEENFMDFLSFFRGESVEPS